MESAQDAKFLWQDYLIFSVSCAMTIVVGIIFAIKDRWGSQNTESYLMGDRNMSWFMVGISAFASVVSAVLFVGPAAEIYYMGIQIVWIVPAMILGTLYTSVVTIPKFFRIGSQITSAYEYLEMRFNLPVRVLASTIYTVGTLLYMAVILYAPCLILAQVSHIDIRWCMVIAAVVCLIYTGFGGLKAVIWVDNIQILIMAIGLITLAVKGTIDAGGPRKIWDLYKEKERMQVFDFSGEVWDRHNFYTLFVVGWVWYAANNGSQQLILQRFMAVKNMRRAQLAAMASVIMFPLFYIFVILATMAAFAQVGGNEPLLTGEIQKRGQIFPYYMMYSLGHLPGLPGLLVAAAFAAALSSLSSGQNSLAAVILEDFIKPIHYRRTKNHMSDSKAGQISRVIGVALGFVILGLGLLMLEADDMVFSLVRSMESFLLGPIFSLMLMAMFMPFVESWGAFIGAICSLLWGIQLYVGSLMVDNGTQGGIGFDFKPLYLNNFTVERYWNTSDVVPTMFHASYRWYLPFDVVVGLVVACVVSLIVLCVKHSRQRKFNRSAMFRDNFTGRGYLYTLDDFLVGMGLKRAEKKNGGEKRLETTESAFQGPEKLPFIDA